MRSTRRSGGRAIALLTGAVVVALTASTPAQRFQRFQRFRTRGYDPVVDNAAYDGRFALARLEYTTGPGGYYYQGLPAWAHGYPRAEHNLMQILNAISAVHPHIDHAEVVALDDPELCRYPVAYMTEAGFWEMNDKEAAGLRAYLLKGGFVIFDDFRPPPRGGGGWDNFVDNMSRVIPGSRFIPLTPAEPIFHVFFDIDSFDIVPQWYDVGRPEFYGLFEHNDPTQRMMAVVNYNTDISNFWEFSGTGYAPVDESNEAYKLGVNYIIYGLTH